MKNIIVFGAGLAGLYAAKEAAINGAKVTVIERKRDVGTALKCGEMFTCIYGMPPAKCVTKEIKNWIFDYSLVPELKNKLKVNVKLPDGFAVMTNRSTHERVLKEECEKLGVKFEFNKITLDYYTELSNYDVVIMATGNPCWEGREAVAKCYTVESDNDTEINYAYFKVLPDLKGYFWYFPKANNEMNVGYGYENDSEYSKKGYSDILINSEHGITISEKIMSGGGLIPINVDYKNLFNYFKLDINYKELFFLLNMKKFNGSLSNLVSSGSSIFCGLIEQIKDINRIYVGDAAGLVNPMLMGGEHLAMISGQVAGYVCATENDTLSIVDKYYKGITEIIAPEFEIGILINNMREVMSPQEYYDFMSGALESKYKEMNDVIIRYIQRVMPKYRKIADVNNKELEELI